MTPEEIKLLRQTFALVEARGTIAALTFYQRLFALDPGVRPLFRGDIENQGKKLMVSLRFIVDSLETPKVLIPALESLGRRHFGYGVRDEHYDTVGSALLDMLQSVLGDGFGARERSAWALAYSTVAGVMKRAAAKMGAPGEPSRAPLANNLN